MEKKKTQIIDIVKFLMALFVVGIHTEPFSFNIWLDRGFGIITRLCVPFFFVISSFLFFSRNGSFGKYILRIFILYLVWSLIYLPFNFNDLIHMDLGSFLYCFFWEGNNYGLWYLLASIIGITLVYLLLKIFKPKTVFYISAIFLLLGCFKSTYVPLIATLIPSKYLSILGFRNGLFYAFPYMSLGMLIAKGVFKERKFSFYLIGFIISTLLLVIESYIFIIKLNTQDTILWLSVLPMTYFFVKAILCIEINLNNEVSRFLRNSSTLIYLIHPAFVMLLQDYLHSYLLFFVVSGLTIGLSTILVYLSKIKQLKFLKYLY